MPTQNGLQKFGNERRLLLRDVELLVRTINSNKGHLGDIVSSLRTAQSSIELKAHKLEQVFINQKKQL